MAPNLAATDEAPPSEAVVDVRPVESGASAPPGGSSLVQGGAQRAGTGGLGSRWRWDKRRRKALTLILNGTPIVEVAAQLKVHRNTITGWMKHPEWLDAMRREVNETTGAAKLRRLKVTQILADRLGAQALQNIENVRTPTDVAKLGLFLREHSNYTKAERDLLHEGQGDGRNAPMVTINLGAAGGPQPVDEAKATTTLLAFRDFMAAYDPKLAVVARSPQEAAALLTEAVLQESDLLEHVRAEDKAEFAARATAYEERKRR